MDLNKRNIFSLVEPDANAQFVDLGCSDGEFTLELAKAIGTAYIYGVDIVNQSLERAEQKGILCYKADLNDELAFEDSCFDVITGN